MADKPHNQWHDFLIAHANNDLLKVAQDQRLMFHSSPVHLHWVDSVCLLLARQAYESQQSLLISYPSPLCNLPALVAAQLVLFNFVQTYTVNDTSMHPSSVMLISPRIEVREQYQGLKIRRQSLAAALPVARIRAQGEPAVIPVPGEKCSLHPHLFHLSRPHLLDTPWPDRLGAIVVDYFNGTFAAYADRIQDLASKQKIATVIHITTDPFAHFVDDLINHGVLSWIWDHMGLADEFGPQLRSMRADQSHPFSVGSTQFRNVADGIRHKMLICRHSAFEAAAQHTWDDLATIQRHFSGHHGRGIHRAIRAAYGAYYAMLQMQVPLPVYEEEARNLWGIRSIQRRIADLEAFAPILRHEASDLADVYWPSLILDLKEMRTSLLAGNPKYDTLVQQLRFHCEARKRLTIICPNHASRQMLRLCLQAHEGLEIKDIESHDTSDNPVRLLTFKEINTLEATDVLLFPGQFSLGRRQYILTTAAPEICYLTYASEANRLEQQIVATHQMLKQMSDDQVRQKTWSALFPSFLRQNLPQYNQNDPEIAIEVSTIEGERIAHKKIASINVSVDLSLWTPFSTAEYDVVQGQDTLGGDEEEALRPSEYASVSRQTALVPALRIEFVDGFCFAEPDSRMIVLLLATGETHERKSQSLRPDDTVVFVDGDQKRQLYETVLDRIRLHPAMGATYLLASYWQQAIREGFFRSGLSYDEFHLKLRRLGSGIETSQAVYFWVQGWVLGPRDGEDIRRIGEVLNNRILIQEWRQINRAVKRVRRLHHSLALKLNRIVVQAGVESQKKDAGDECIDRELNLYLDDFRDSISLHRVLRLNEEPEQVPYVLTGRFFEKGTELTW